MRLSPNQIIQIVKVTFKEVDTLTDLNQDNVIEKIKVTLEEKGLRDSAIYKLWEENQFSIDYRLLELYLSGQTLLHYAFQYNCSNVANALIAKGANVNLTHNFGCTALYWATKNRDTEMVKLLFKNGANVNVASQKYNPLRSAIENDDREMCELIVNHIAKLEAAGEHVSEENLELKKQLMPEIQKRTFIYNNKPLIDALPKPGYNNEIEQKQLNEQLFNAAKEGNVNRIKEVLEPQVNIYNIRN